MEVTQAEFREALGRFATGVTIVTLRGSDGEPYGLTVNAFTSLSLDPLLILICLDNSFSEIESFSTGRRFCVNILSRDQQGLSEHFATPGSDRSRAGYREGKTGVPVLEGARASLECRITEILPGGDHTIVVGEVGHITLSEEGGEPLLFYEGRYWRLAPPEGPGGREDP